MSFEQVIIILRARWRLALGVFIGIVLIVVALSLIWPKQYKATASVVIDAKTDPVAGAIGGNYTEQLLASYVTTQADVIASERVALRVVRLVGLDKDPVLQRKWQSSTRGQGDISVWLADYLLEKKLTVTSTQGNAARASNVIEISVRWRDARTAAALANGFAQSAIDTNIELKVEPAKQYAGWFEGRARALRADLELKQKRLSEFQQATGIIATDEKLDLENARLGELSTQLVSIQGQRQDSQSRQRQVSGDNASLPEVLQSPVIASLKKDLADAEAKEQDIVGRLGKNHPDYQAAKAEVDALHGRILQETGRIAASLGNTSQVDIRRENDIRLALEQQKRRVMDLKHQHDDAAVLENDVQTAQRDLDAVTQRLAQSSLESLTQQTNIVQLTTAAVPIKPSSPKVLLNLILSVVVGAVIAVVTALLFEFRDPRIRNSRELLELLGVPVLGNIPRVTLCEKNKPREVPAHAELDPSVI
jgi:chain length determinant protein EpsF